MHMPVNHVIISVRVTSSELRFSQLSTAPSSSPSFEMSYRQLGLPECGLFFTWTLTSFSSSASGLSPVCMLKAVRFSFCFFRVVPAPAFMLLLWFVAVPRFNGPMSGQYRVSMSNSAVPLSSPVCYVCPRPRAVLSFSARNTSVLPHQPIRKKLNLICELSRA